nr:FtsX-like permease family protein [bacterium]
MNILFRITRKTLWHNKAALAATLVCIVLASALITAVGGLADTFRQFRFDNVLYSEGSWHMCLSNAAQETVQKVNQAAEIDRQGQVVGLGYANYDIGLKKNRPYLYIAQMQKNVADLVSFHIKEGRLPENDRELMIPDEIAKKLSVGQTLVLPIGDRVAPDGTILGQITNAGTSPSQPMTTGTPDAALQETFVQREERTYTIVGIYHTYDLTFQQDYDAPGYNVITLAGENPPQADALLAFFTFKHPSQAYSMREQGVEAYTTFNHAYLECLGISDPMAPINPINIAYTAGVLLVLLVGGGAIMLISANFMISVSERSRQFGLLASIGATPGQIRTTVMMESLLLAGIGIPIGMLLGIGGIWLIIHTLGDAYILYSSIGSNIDPIYFKLAISPITCAAALVISLLTTALSAWSPARNAAKASPIEAIRQHKDIKLKAQDIQITKKKNRAIERTMALKTFKRNRKRYRGTIAALTTSVVLIMAAGSLYIYLIQGQQSMSYYSEDIHILTTEEVPGNPPADRKLYDRLADLSCVTDIWVVDRLYCSATFPEEYVVPLVRESQMYSSHYGYLGTILLAYDDKLFASYAASLGLDAELFMDAQNPAAIAINRIQTYDYSQKKFLHGPILDMPLPYTLPLTAGQDTLGQITIAHFASALPKKDYAWLNGCLLLVIPQSVLNGGSIQKHSSSLPFVCLNVQDAEKDEAAISQAIAEAGLADNTRLYNVALTERSELMLYRILLMGGMGIAATIVLVTLFNITNVVSANLRVRRRELAMLSSIGMDMRAMRRMLDYECLIYSIRALLIGIPIGIAIHCFLYIQSGRWMGLTFTLPWIPMLICIVLVLLVAWATMSLGRKAISRHNIIDSLRGDCY